MVLNRRTVIWLVTILFSLCRGGSVTAGTITSSAVAILPTPVFHTPGIADLFGGNTGKALRLDSCGQMRELEFVAFPGTVFHIEETISSGRLLIYRVTTDEYPYPTDKGYFIESRFVKVTDQNPTARPRRLPSRKEVIENLVAARGINYVWGGNFRKGIPQLLALYPVPPGHKLSSGAAAHRQLQGVDCSGLLYEATNGYTPRNTSALVKYGTPVSIANADMEHIIRSLEPLDLIVRQGHVMIVLDKERLIESRLGCRGNNGGVRIRPLSAALKELLQEKIPVDSLDDASAKGGKGFVIRRWHDSRGGAH